ncbi:hypothetical protein B0H14DRAFT_3863296 [Mycena olivaceomarginata]|nr:hypothetical protein B0H14DRAFT_3863296 [Mycena olivaceomarginata]
MDICIGMASINSCARRDQSRSTLFDVVGNDNNKICLKNHGKNMGYGGYIYDIHDRVTGVRVVNEVARSVPLAVDSRSTGPTHTTCLLHRTTPAYPLPPAARRFLSAAPGSPPACPFVAAAPGEPRLPARHLLDRLPHCPGPPRYLLPPSRSLAALVRHTGPTHTTCLLPIGPPPAYPARPAARRCPQLPVRCPRLPVRCPRLPTRSPFVAAALGEPTLPARPLLDRLPHCPGRPRYLRAVVLIRDTSPRQLYRTNTRCIPAPHASPRPLHALPHQ